MQNQALKKTLKIEGLEDECKNIDEEFRAIRDQEEQKKEQLKKYEEELEKITNEYENAVENSSDRNNSLEEVIVKIINGLYYIQHVDSKMTCGPEIYY